MAKNNAGNAGFTSGFSPYPQQGFQIQPPQNYWEGGNFHIPGINAGAPSMTSSIMSNFPALSNILRMQSPPSFFQMGGAPFVGAVPRPFTPSPMTPSKPKSKIEEMLQGWRNGRLGQ